MVTIKLFATLKDMAGTSEIVLSDPPPTVKELLAEISRKFPLVGNLLSGQRKILISVNQEFADESTPVKPGDEIGLMPPFSGGENRPGAVRIQAQPFSVDAEIESLKALSKSIGGIVTFLGTTRDISRGTTVTKLDFEHYPGMAEKKLEEIRNRAISEFGVIDITIIHRIGVLPVGENIVLIVVAAGHRDEAFRACRFCIDELKRITPIWKKETTQEGVVWVEEHP